MVGHKFYGPRIGALYHRQGASDNGQLPPPLLAPFFFGGGQERGLRSGSSPAPQ